MPTTQDEIPTEIAEALAGRVPGAELRRVTKEPAVLGTFSEELGVGRAVPRGVMIPFRGWPSIPARYALGPNTLEVRDRHTGELLRADSDYVVDPIYGSLCLPPDATGTNRDVDLSYEYSLSRLDRLERSSSGELSLVTGIGHLSAPVAPRPRDGFEFVALVFVPHFAQAGEFEVFLPAAERSPLPESTGQLPGMKALLAAGEPVRIVFLGDSITEGGDASTDRDAFAAIASEGIRAAFPEATIDTVVVARGGSRSHQWLDDNAFPECDWSRVDAAKPQVTIVEFLNDTYVDHDSLQQNYDELIRRLRALGSEIVLTTPPFTAAATMDDPDHRGIDSRPYVLWLRDYAAANRLPLIDVSRRWEQLREEALPYWTLLINSLNHPDDRGHQMAGELIAQGIHEMVAR